MDSFNEKVGAMLEEMRSALQGHGGDLELVAIEGKTVQLRTVLLPTSSWTSVLSSPTLFTFTTSLLLSLLLFSLL